MLSTGHLVIFYLVPFEGVALTGRVGYVETFGVEYFGTDGLEIQTLVLRRIVL